MKAVPELLVGPHFDPRSPASAGSLHFGPFPALPLPTGHIGGADAFARRDIDDGLESGLATACRGHGWTFLAFPAPIVAASSLVAAFRSAPIVAWSSQRLTIVGVGAAYELRGTGEYRWHDVIAAARRLETSGVLDIDAGFDHEARPCRDDGAQRNDLLDDDRRDDRCDDRRDERRDDRREELDRRALARPRLLGGLAFAPGAADRAPWTGFGDAWFMLPRWTYLHDGMRAALLLAVDAHDAQHTTRWRDELAAMRTALATTFVARPQPPSTMIDHGDRDAFRAQIRAITAAIDCGEYAKIVAARSAIVSLAGEARAADMLAELDARHADCVRLLVRPPGGGALIAATPERLVRVDGTAVACDALAGSLARGPTAGRVDHVDANSDDLGLADGFGIDRALPARPMIPELIERKQTDELRPTDGFGIDRALPARQTISELIDRRDGPADDFGPAGESEVVHERVGVDAPSRRGDQPKSGTIAEGRDADATLLASAKDRREHDLVVHAITSALREVGADVEVPAEPAVRTLRHVLHLHTPIAATLHEPRHLLEIAAALHPTPAVGGTPTRVATDWIAAHEVVPRGWYAAPVGWFDLDGNGELAVAIRSGLLAGDHAHLWAGAGIVAGSDPDRELAETEIKLRAMLGALGVAR